MHKHVNVIQLAEQGVEYLHTAAAEGVGNRCIFNLSSRFTVIHRGVYATHLFAINRVVSLFSVVYTQVLGLRNGARCSSQPTFQCLEYIHHLFIYHCIHKDTSMAKHLY